MFKPTWLMIKQHDKTGLKYFCKTVRSDPYAYKGSGVRWSHHLKKHGRDVSTIWCKLFNSVQELSEYAIQFSIENNIVASPKWANLVVENGITGWPVGTKHKTSSIELLRKNAAGFKKGHVPHNKGQQNSPAHHALQLAGMYKFRKINPNGYQKILENLKPTATREANRKKAIKEKLSGSNNHNYDDTVYVFKNKKTEEILKITRSEFIHRFNAPPQNVYQLIKGKRKSVIGWYLLTR